MGPNGLRQESAGSFDEFKDGFSEASTQEVPPQYHAKAGRDAQGMKN